MGCQTIFIFLRQIQIKNVILSIIKERMLDGDSTFWNFGHFSSYDP